MKKLYIQPEIEVETLLPNTLMLDTEGNSGGPQEEARSFKPNPGGGTNSKRTPAF